jgi:AraC-like DNA-binding protein
MSAGPSVVPLAVLAHPYTSLRPIQGSRQTLKEASLEPGTAVVWRMGTAASPPEADLLATRPGGLALLVVLPHPSEVNLDPSRIRLVQRLRPTGILPYHDDLDPTELAHVLRRPPRDLAGEITDYMAWRGLNVDHATVRLIRRIVELAQELRSVSALARGMYMSRRALGRRFMNLGLPVPSHWLQMARLLRVAVRLQNTEATVFSVAYEFGYPDGFSVSNQMHRLLGYRPTDVRERLGWEWLFEAWLRREAENGSLTPMTRERINSASSKEPATPPTLRRPGRSTPRVHPGS